MTAPSAAAPYVSVIIRALDEAASVERCIELIRSQRTGGRAVEIVVVDGGSRDRTAEAARKLGAHVVAITPQAFTYGRSLNLGCANSGGELLVALSAHAHPLDPAWLLRLIEPFSDPRVACACGDIWGPDGRPLGARIDQDVELARRRPEWGYSNSAGAFRARLWRERPFREDLAGCEDKEWSWRWLEKGYVCAIDPALVVEHDHTRDALNRIYARARCEWEDYASLLSLPAYGWRDLARDWWSDLRFYDSATRARLSPRRAARMLGAYAGRRRTRRRAER